MPATQRRPQSSVMRRLIERPQQYQFFQAIHLIELWLRRSGQTLDRVLRFKNSVSLSFPASEIESLEVEADRNGDRDELLKGLQEGPQALRVHVTPAFMSFLGVSGVLPYSYTGVIAAQIHFDKDESSRALFDCFFHRPMTLFYRAWEKCHVEYRHDGRGKDGFLPLQLALAGCLHAGAAPGAVEKKGSAIPAEVIAHYAALMRHRPIAAEMIVGVLNEYFGVPFRMEQFAGDWEDLPPDQRTRLGGSKRQLGADAMLGRRYWCRELCVRLWIGPLPRSQFDHFLPTAPGSEALKALLALFAEPTLRFDVRLVLRAGDVHRAQLNRSCQLGRGMVLATRPVTANYDELRYQIRF